MLHVVAGAGAAANHLPAAAAAAAAAAPVSAAIAQIDRVAATAPLLPHGGYPPMEPPHQYPSPPAPPPPGNGIKKEEEPDDWTSDVIDGGDRHRVTVTVTGSPGDGGPLEPALRAAPQGQQQQAQSPPAILQAAAHQPDAEAAAREQSLQSIDARMARLFHEERAASRPKRIRSEMAARERRARGGRSFTTAPSPVTGRLAYRGAITTGLTTRAAADRVARRLEGDARVDRCEVVPDREGDGQEENVWLRVYMASTQDAYEAVRGGLACDERRTRFHWLPQPVPVDERAMHDGGLSIEMTTPRVSATVRAALLAAGSAGVRPLNDEGLRLTGFFADPEEWRTAALVLNGAVVEGALLRVLPPPPYLQL